MKKSRDSKISKLEYEEIPRLSRGEISSYIMSDKSKLRSLAALSASLYQSDWKYAQSICLHCAKDDDLFVARSGIFGLSHIARIHGVIDSEYIIHELKHIQHHKDLIENISELESDIRIFLK